MDSGTTMLWVFFGTWAAWAVFAGFRKWSGTYAFGGGFLVAILVLIAGIQVTNYFQANSDSKKLNGYVETAQTVAPVEIKTHNYSLKDGYQYGYERAISTEDANQGKAASELLMVRYAGTKGGDFQAYVIDGSLIAVFQCSSPCEFIKIMTFMNYEHIKTDRMRAVEGTMGWSVMSDAINGKLDQYIGQRNGKNVHVWFDEKNGAISTPI